ncbi:MAG TPA: HIT domain-containing protein [Armatimonadota bacterium]|nr:HIT domain-containing protein [Armatimonadota bacterium]
MERLWAPWRMQYIEQGGRVRECLFCELPAQLKDEENFVLYRGETGFIMLNSFPYNSGHLMVAPFKHTADMYELEDDELLEISHLIRYSVRLLTAAVQPDGFNLGMNLGRSAGAGVADHIHWHIVPRWNGDTNFMPVTAGTKVLPESLRSTYDKLKKKMEELGAP